METQNEVTSETLATLATTVATVATQHAAYTESLTVERQAETALLTKIIDTVKPALRALARQIKSYDFSTSGNNGCNPVRRYRIFDEVGVILVDSYTRDKDATGNGGTYDGSQLYLLSDGRLAEVEREGTWSRWQGVADTYTATLKIVDAVYAVRIYHLTDIIQALNAKLEEQAKGNTTKRTKAAIERAAQLAALTALTK